MEEREQLEQLKKNILSLSMSMIDAPLRGLSESQIWTVNKTLENILGKTDITIEKLMDEAKEKGWFKPNNK
ncbi:hypothetical protein ACS52_11480 [Bacillus cereus]|uniref:hypothetical protein n=1 Tax=Bacillus cereus group sp. BcHK140 TaxID=3018092 RepID=UPI0007724AE2|nr:hypothetical protein [Bacillus cereus group sp. BcHK140]KXI78634.1 hypothetical protein ACS52_11480 [Bacillus cereus]MDA1920678.1 hypothetical protein [Bacillus cereus group sp. BcHK140]